MNEEWRPVVGFEGWYEVSNMGRVKRIKPSKGTKAGKILRPKHNRHTGYLRVTLSRFGVTTEDNIHRFVAEAFIGKLSDKLEVNHRNGVKDDNRVENLEIVTHSMNAIHNFRVLGHSTRGEAIHTSKLTAAQVTAIRTRSANGERSKDLAREFGVDYDTIWAIVTRRKWKHLP